MVMEYLATLSDAGARTLRGACSGGRRRRLRPERGRAAQATALSRRYGRQLAGMPFGDEIRKSTSDGGRGLRCGSMPTSRGRLAALRMLQGAHDVTTFSHEVGASAAARDDVVERQVSRAAAVLAAVAVAGQHGAARESPPIAAGHPDVRLQADDQRLLHGQAFGVELTGAGLEHLGLAFEEQDDGAPGRADVDGLVGRVQHQYLAGHDTTSRRTRRHDTEGERASSTVGSWLPPPTPAALSPVSPPSGSSRRHRRARRPLQSHGRGRDDRGSPRERRHSLQRGARAGSAAQRTAARAPAARAARGRGRPGRTSWGRALPCARASRPARSLR